MVTSYKAEIPKNLYSRINTAHNACNLIIENRKKHINYISIMMDNLSKILIRSTDLSMKY